MADCFIEQCSLLPKRRITLKVLSPIFSCKERRRQEVSEETLNSITGLRPET